MISRFRPGRWRATGPADTANLIVHRPKPTSSDRPWRLVRNLSGRLFGRGINSGFGQSSCPPAPPRSSAPHSTVRTPPFTVEGHIIHDQRLDLTLSRLMGIRWVQFLCGVRASRATFPASHSVACGVPHNATPVPMISMAVAQAPLCDLRVWDPEDARAYAGLPLLRYPRLWVDP
jgi:hypothetical protein